MILVICGMPPLPQVSPHLIMQCCLCTQEGGRAPLYLKKSCLGGGFHYISSYEAASSFDYMLPAN